MKAASFQKRLDCARNIIFALFHQLSSPLLPSSSINPTTQTDNEVALIPRNIYTSPIPTLRRESCHRLSLSCEYPLRPCSSQSNGRSPSANETFNQLIDLEEVPDFHCLLPPGHTTESLSITIQIRSSCALRLSRVRLYPRATITHLSL